MPDRRTILVTGCSDGGLGSALAMALHERGWRVFATARNPSKLRVAKAAGLECLQLDVVSEDSIARAVAEVTRLTGGALDALINNAGAGHSTPLIHVDMDRAHDLFDLNALSILRVTRAFLPLLLKSPSDALVVNTTSSSALLGVGLPLMGAYNATKAAAASITEGLRLELAPFGVRVVNLVPGAVKSAFADNAPSLELPSDSIYGPARDRIQQAMNGPPAGFEPSDAEAWARQVAADLGRSRPPHMLFSGAQSTKARLAALLPLGWLDSVLMSSMGLDVLTREVKKKGIPGKAS